MNQSGVHEHEMRRCHDSAVRTTDGDLPPLLCAGVRRERIYSNVTFVLPVPLLILLCCCLVAVSPTGAMSDSSSVSAASTGEPSFAGGTRPLSSSTHPTSSASVETAGSSSSVSFPTAPLASTGQSVAEDSEDIGWVG